MNVHIELEKIDLSEHHLGELRFSSLEAEIRRMAAEYIKGVLENNLRLEVQQVEFDPDADGEQTGPMYVVLWANLNDGWESAIAEIKVDALFKEFLKKRS